jgi:hypothetical protein
VLVILTVAAISVERDLETLAAGIATVLSVLGTLAAVVLEVAFANPLAAILALPPFPPFPFPFANM